MAVYDPYENINSLFANTGVEPLVPARDQGEFSKGLSAGFENVKAFGHGLLSTMAAFVGADDFAVEQAEKYKSITEAAGREYAPKVGSVFDIEGLADAGDWAAYNLANVIPTVLPMLASGGIGGVVAKKLGQKAIQRTVAGLVESGASKKAVAEAAEKAVEQWGKRIVSAQTLSAGAASVGMQTGSITGDIYAETGELRPGVGAAFGLATGALDVLPIANVFKRLGIGREAAEAIGEKAAKDDIWLRVAKGVAEQGSFEGLTEAAQTTLERLAIQWVDENKRAFTEEGIKEILNAAAVGVLAGGVMGVPAGLVSPTEKKTDEDEGEQPTATSAYSRPIGPERSPTGFTGTPDDIIRARFEGQYDKPIGPPDRFGTPISGGLLGPIEPALPGAEPSMIGGDITRTEAFAGPALLANREADNQIAAAMSQYEGPIGPDRNPLILPNRDTAPPGASPVGIGMEVMGQTSVEDSITVLAQSVAGKSAAFRERAAQLRSEDENASQRAAAFLSLRDRFNLISDTGRQLTEQQEFPPPFPERPPRIPVDRSAIAREQTRRRKMVNPDRDSLTVAVAKLGGVTREQAEAEGFDPAGFNTRPVFGSPLFRKDGGRSFDEMAEALREYGFTVPGGNELVSMLSDEVNGVTSHYSVNAQLAFEEMAAEKEAEQMELQESRLQSDMFEAAVYEDSDPFGMADDLGAYYDESVEGDGVVKVIYARTQLAKDLGVSEDKIERALERDVPDREIALELDGLIQEARNAQTNTAGVGRPVAEGQGDLAAGTNQRGSGGEGAQLPAAVPAEGGGEAGPPVAQKPAPKGGLGRIAALDYIESVSDERSTGDGYWAYLKPGYTFLENPGSTTAHENTLLKLREYTKASNIIRTEDADKPSPPTLAQEKPAAQKAAAPEAAAPEAAAKPKVAYFMVQQVLTKKDGSLVTKWWNGNQRQDWNKAGKSWRSSAGAKKQMLKAHRDGSSVYTTHLIAYDNKGKELYRETYEPEPFTEKPAAEKTKARTLDTSPEENPVAPDVNGVEPKDVAPIYKKDGAPAKPTVSKALEGFRRGFEATRAKIERALDEMPEAKIKQLMRDAGVPIGMKGTNPARSRRLAAAKILEQNFLGKKGADEIEDALKRVNNADPNLGEELIKVLALAMPKSQQKMSAVHTPLNTGMIREWLAKKGIETADPSPAPTAESKTRGPKLSENTKRFRSQQTRATDLIAKILMKDVKSTEDKVAANKARMRLLSTAARLADKGGSLKGMKKATIDLLPSVPVIGRAADAVGLTQMEEPIAGTKEWDGDAGTQYLDTFEQFIEALKKVDAGTFDAPVVPAGKPAPQKPTAKQETDKRQAGKAKKAITFSQETIDALTQYRKATTGKKGTPEAIEKLSHDFVRAFTKDAGRSGVSMTKQDALYWLKEGVFPVGMGEDIRDTADAAVDAWATYGDKPIAGKEAAGRALTEAIDKWNKAKSQKTGVTLKEGDLIIEETGEVNEDGDPMYAINIKDDVRLGLDPMSEMTLHLASMNNPDGDPPTIERTTLDQLPEEVSRLFGLKKIGGRLAGELREASQREIELIAGAIKRLLDNGMPISYLDGLGGFGVTPAERSSSKATYFVATRAIGVRDDMLAALDANMGNADYHETLIRFVAHEIHHHVETRGQGTSAVVVSPRFDIDVTLINEGEVDVSNLGDVMQEVFDVFESGVGNLDNFFAYPLDFLKRVAKGSGSTATLKQEVFAQLGALYSIQPALMKRHLPRSFQMMEEIADGHRQHKDTQDQVIRSFYTGQRVLGALQTGRPPARIGLSDLGDTTQEVVTGWGSRTGVAERPEKRYRPKRYTPVRTKAGDYIGAPAWVKTPADYKKLRALLWKLTEEGAKGKYWYERSSREIWEVARGNYADAEKITQLIAIYSPQNPVFTNLNQALKAWYLYKSGVPREKFRVRPFGKADNNSDTKAISVLYDNEPWAGRKTGNFYMNLMAEINNLAGKPHEGGQVTVDMWISRAFGYDSDIVSSGLPEQKENNSQYSFMERELVYMAEQTGWEPHQIQAAMWTGIKGRHENPTVKAKTWRESLKRGHSHMVKGKPQKKTDKDNMAAHRMLWREKALELEELKQEDVDSAMFDFGHGLNLITTQVPWDASPSADVSSIIATANPEIQEDFKAKATQIIVDEFGNDLLAESLGAHINWLERNSGGSISSLVQLKPSGFFERETADAYAKAIAYIFKQSRVPWFRAAENHKFSKEYGVANADGTVISRYETQAEAEARVEGMRGTAEEVFLVLDPVGNVKYRAKTMESAEATVARSSKQGYERSIEKAWVVRNPDGKIIKYTDEAGNSRSEYRSAAEARAAARKLDRAKVVGKPYSMGVKLTFDGITVQKEKDLMDWLVSKYGDTAGYTKVNDNEVVIINFRNKDGVPEMTDDETFQQDMLGFVKENGRKYALKEIKRFGAETQNDTHDWSGSGKSLFDKGLVARRPAVQSWIRSRREVYEALVNQYEGRVTGEIQLGANSPLPKRDFKITIRRKQEQVSPIEASINAKIGRQSRIERVKEEWRAGPMTFLAGIKERTIAATVDSFRGLLNAEKLVGISPDDPRSAYVSARLASASADLLYSLMNYGSLNWKEGAPALSGQFKGGFFEILKPVSGKLDDFGKYLVGMRADKLSREDKEKLFTQDEIAYMKNLGNINPEFAGVAAKYAEFNKLILDFAEEAGVINPEKRAEWEHAEYVPFFRAVDNEVVAPPSKPGLSGQNPIRRLEGKPLAIGDPFENILMNWNKIIDASLKNHAMRQAVENFTSLGEGSQMFMSKVEGRFQSKSMTLDQFKHVLIDQGVDIRLLNDEVMAQMQAIYEATHHVGGNSTVTVMVDGKPVKYYVHDALLLKSLTYFSTPGLGKFMEFLRVPKRWLTTFVTIDPAFMLRNFVRDSLHSFVIARDKMTPVVPAARNIFKMYSGSDMDAQGMVAGGGAFIGGGYMNANDPGASKRLIQAAMKSEGFRNSLLDTGPKLVDFWNRVGSSIENANRLTIYKAAKEAGKTNKQALYEARDLMDFALRGYAPWMKFLTETVPFMNARIQGMYRLGRGSVENPKAFAAKGGLITMASLAIYMMNKDDDRFQELEEWDRDTYFHFFIGDDHYRLPKPFEVGVLFGTIPERMLEAFTGGDPGAERFWKSFFWNMGETMALNPIPQTLKPLIEQWANKSFFTDRPILSMRLESIAPEGQFDPWTSETMRELASTDLGRAMNLSPKRAEAVIRGFFGQVGIYVLGASDLVVNQLGDYPASPERRIDEYPVIKSFVRAAPARSTRYVTDMYEMFREADQAYRLVRDARGDPERAKELRDIYSTELGMRKALQRASKSISAINKQIRMIHDSTGMTPMEKRTKIDELIERKNDIARRAVDRVA